MLFMGSLLSPNQMQCRPLRARVDPDFLSALGSARLAYISFLQPTFACQIHGRWNLGGALPGTMHNTSSTGV
jgi:hypothetical protein